MHGIELSIVSDVFVLIAALVVVLLRGGFAALDSCLHREGGMEYDYRRREGGGCYIKREKK